MNVEQAIQWKQTDKLFVSLAAKPGKTGEQFYNTLFKHHNIDAEYVACECTDLAADMRLVREHCAGASITMPYKQQIIKYIDNCSTPDLPINTVVNRNKVLAGYNCDFLGLKDTINSSIKDKKVIILGDGAMSVNASLVCLEAKRVEVLSRRKNNWDLRHKACDVVINTTSIGMDQNQSPLDKISAELVIDCVIGPTLLINRAKEAKLKYIEGSNIYINQFIYQFKLYTGIEPDRQVVSLIAKKVFDA